ncbi:shTK domain protein [Teladorsagia circumcincta]|uniref:ShTK domain protein n=1 Tax=Teladorsagia circumcincta TaxID=45464 RepID=A0A2G9UPF2_TELCI|nr:shTK domain protein [Teladorsagia circumcincta]
METWPLEERLCNEGKPLGAPGTAGINSLGVSTSAVSTSTTPSSAYDCLDIACLCGFFGGTGGTTCTLPNGQALTKAIRKEYRVMTDDERQNYHTAMWTIKGNGDYDDIARIHSQFITSPGAHSGPAFLPWHREYIKRVEIALRRVDPSLALPYWDSTLDETLPNPAQSCMWGSELMGTQESDGSVRTGAFRNWLTVDGSRVFTRNIGRTGNLLREADIQIILNSPDFRQLLAFTAPQTGCPNPAPWTVLEYVHGGPHVFTGGDMLITTSATNDPLFFNHHSMIDHIWELWRIARQSRSLRETQYPADNSLCSSTNHFSNNTMAPFFPKVNVDGLSNSYTDEDRCYLGQCMNNICAMTPTPTPTTQPPIETTTPTVPVQETCYNEQQCCAPWASRGECSRNPTYMNLWCKASCGVCTPTTNNFLNNYNLYNYSYHYNDGFSACSDFATRCATWTAQNQCTVNRNYMWENCRQSCGSQRRGPTRPGPPSTALSVRPQSSPRLRQTPQRLQRPSPPKRLAQSAPRNVFRPLQNTQRLPKRTCPVQKTRKDSKRKPVQKTRKDSKRASPSNEMPICNIQ